MNIFMDGYSMIFSVFYFPTCIIICSYFLMNLTVAVMLDHFIALNQKDDEVQELIQQHYYNHFTEKCIERGEEPPSSMKDLPALNIEKVRKSIKESMSKKRDKNIHYKVIINRILKGLFYKKLADIPQNRKYYNYKLTRVAYRIVQFPFFNTFIYSLIIANTITLSLDKYPDYGSETA